MVEKRIFHSADGQELVARTYSQGEIIPLHTKSDPKGWWVEENPLAKPVQYSLWTKEWCEPLGYSINQIVATGFKTEQEAEKFKEEYVQDWKNA